MKIHLSAITIAILFILNSCETPSNGNTETEPTLQTTQLNFKGQTMGTTYSIVAHAEGEPKCEQSEIDTFLAEFNRILSTYDPNSMISQFNQFKSSESFEINDLFYEVLASSQRAYEVTHGAFDPTVMPLVNYWGFGYKQPDSFVVDSDKVAQLTELVGFDKIKFFNEEGRSYVWKENPDMELDFSAVAKGYGVDKVAEILEEKGYENYMVEIGGEVVAKGVNEEGKIWTLGIEKPIEGERALQTAVYLENKGMATSGNYRRFKEIDGRKVVHTINPKTGYPEISNLLSATVLAPDCVLADAYATGLMAMGYIKADKTAHAFNMTAILIYSQDGEMKVRNIGEVQEMQLNL